MHERIPDVFRGGQTPGQQGPQRQFPGNIKKNWRSGAKLAHCQLVGIPFIIIIIIINLVFFS